MKRKYLLLEEIQTENTEIHWRNYYYGTSISIEEVLGRDTLELEDEEAKRLSNFLKNKYPKLKLVLIKEKNTIKKLMEESIEFEKKELEKEQQKKEIQEKRNKKRQETIRKKQEEKDKKEILRLAKKGLIALPE